MIPLLDWFFWGRFTRWNLLVIAIVLWQEFWGDIVVKRISNITLFRAVEGGT
jgi:hypothetical protein